MNAKPDAPATRRNRDAILEVLAIEFAHCHRVLEIGSGTGQHAVHFGAALTHLVWQTSDRSGQLEGIRAWVDDEGTGNVLAPIDLDVLAVPRVDGGYDAIFSANTAHIMSWDAVVGMFGLVGNTLPVGAPFCLYGPFNVGSRFTSDSNRRFDESLQSQDPSMGIRNLEDLDDLACANEMARRRQYAMPANNMLVTWQKGG